MILSYCVLLCVKTFPSGMWIMELQASLCLLHPTHFRHYTLNYFYKIWGSYIVTWIILVGLQAPNHLLTENLAFHLDVDHCC